MYLFHTRKSIHPFLFHIIHLTVLYNFIVLALTSIVVISCAVLFRKEFNSKGNNFFLNFSFTSPSCANTWNKNVV